jgi:predicted site-specific integrase-resolvase
MLIKLTKAAKDLGVTKVTLYNWHKKGLITFVKSPTGLNFLTEEEYIRLKDGRDKIKEV